MTHAPGDQYDAVLREAAHRLASALEPYGVLTREKLEEFSGASRWSTIDFDQALHWAVEHEVVRRLDEDLYEIGPAADPDERSGLGLEGGW
jgi:hypothetical protein